jgi:SAM-dependent methyltransferase
MDQEGPVHENENENENENGGVADRFVGMPAGGPGTNGLERGEGRDLYGTDPAGYDAGRPEYPPQLYDVLTHRCGLGPGTSTLEIGPGTGRVTRQLLAAGASVTAVEPNAGMAAWLRDAFTSEPLRVVQAPLEDAVLDEAAFDLAVAGTSIHWVDPDAAAGQLRRALRRGGSLALWWMLFEDPWRPDAFDEALPTIFGSPASVRSARGLPFQVEEELICGQLRAAGVADVESQMIRSHHVLDTSQLRDLYATTAVILRRPPQEQARVLEAMVRMIEDEFQGRVARTFVTALYTGRNP